MKLRTMALICAVVLISCLANSALLAQDNIITFVVLPFKINGSEKYQYLSTGIQDMLISRLHWKKRVESVDKNVVNQSQNQNLTEETVDQLRQKLGCDWVVWGTLTVTEEQCSLDVYITGKKTVKPKTVQVPMNNLLATLERTARDINTEIFELNLMEQEVPTSVEQHTTKGGINKTTPGLVSNEDKQNSAFYLNPQFRYAGDTSTEGRLTTQSLPFVALGIIVGDLDKDSHNEIAIISDSGVHVFRMDDSRLKPVAELVVGAGLQNINISLLDLNKDNVPEIVVSSALRNEKGTTERWYEYLPRSYILNLKNNKLEIYAKDIPWFFNVLKLPPTWIPTLIGQKKGERGLFDKSLYQINVLDKQFTMGKKIILPADANAFNFNYLPQETGYKILTIDGNDHIRVYTESGDRQHTTDSVYSGSALGLEYDESFPGIQDKRLQKGHYYVPARILATNLGNDNRHKILVNHPVSVASMFFERYRFFPQGEIHCLAWDGIGMSLVWKTRRIKGSVVDFGVGDINNSGTNSLFVLLNTHPGAIPLKARRSQILFYPLDPSRTTKNNPVDQEFRDEHYPDALKHQE